MAQYDYAMYEALRETADRYHENMNSEVREFLKARGIGDDLIAEYRLGVCDDVYDGWLAIPYLRPSGVVAQIRFRRLDNEKPKYMGHGHPHLYNTAVLEQADRTGEIAICEGELDALVATSLCGVPAVGIPGATQWTGHPVWKELFVGYQRIWVLADPDEAGLKLASAILESLPQARLVHLPADVNETYLQHGNIKEFIHG